MGNALVAAQQNAVISKRDKALQHLLDTVWLMKRYPDDMITHVVYSKKKGLVAIAGSCEEDVCAVYDALTDGKTSLRGRVLTPLTDDEFKNLLKYKDVLLPLLPGGGQPGT